MSSAIDLNSTNEIFSTDQKNLVEEDKTEVLCPMDTENEIITPSQTSTKSEDIDEKPDSSSQPLHDPSFILEGKRSRKPTLRLEMSESVPTKKEFSIPQGHGTPLGEIEYISHQISHASIDALSRMHFICFGRRGSKTTVRKHVRGFKGFEFAPNGTEYQKHYNNLIKMRKDELRSISNILGLPLTGRNANLVERISNFLIKPIDEGRKVPSKKPAARKSKKRSTHSKDSANTDTEAKEEKTENGSDYNFKPGKKSSKKRSSDPTESKRKKSPSKSEEDEVEPSNDKPEIPAVDPVDDGL